MYDFFQYMFAGVNIEASILFFYKIFLFFGLIILKKMLYYVI